MSWQTATGLRSSTFLTLTDTRLTWSRMPRRSEIWRLLSGARREVGDAGRPDPSRVVVIEFPNYAVALECYRSPEYAKAMELREGKSVMDLTIVEGYDGPQP
jgi:hypothetical protein